MKPSSRFAHGFATARDRLTTPLLRRNGSLEPASWEEALELIGERLRRIIAVHGPDAVAAISSARATNEENYLLQKLMRAAIGTNNVDNCSRLCHAPSAAGLVAAFGLVVIDPRRTELAEVADVHLAGRPGSNVAVFHGIAHLSGGTGSFDDLDRADCILVGANPTEAHP